MSLQMVSGEPARRIAPEELARMRSVAPAVGRAARLLLKQARTSLPKADLEALGMLAIWRKLQDFDPARSPFDRWAFCQALCAMMDASREEHREALFETAVRRALHGYVALDDRPPERDVLDDTPETDAGRLRARTRRACAAAWLEVVFEHQDDTAPAERSIAAAEAVRAVREEVAGLSSELRAALHLRFWDDVEMMEEAARAGMSERTLRRRWVQARELLEKRLRARGIFGVPDGFAEAADALGEEKRGDT